MMREVNRGVVGAVDEVVQFGRAARLVNRLRRPWRRQRAALPVAVERAAALELLENRVLMSVGVTATTTAPFISEFLAVNNSGLKDEDGDRPDWFELYNPTPGDVDLAGYHLTDDAAALTKWTSPAAGS